MAALIDGAVDATRDTVFNLNDAAKRFDLDKENIHNVFDNTTLLAMLLVSIAGNKIITPKETFRDEYDYVIVGGGTAGSVMASRLSQKSCVSVLLLEAGGIAPFLAEVPAASTLQYKGEIDWVYKTVPQRYCCGAQQNRQVLWNSGKALGGSSCLNAMLYVRGNKKNYDRWAEEGCEGWSYKEVFPYFLKLEDNKNIKELDKDCYRTAGTVCHRSGGPMTAERINYSPEIKEPILEAFKDLGFQIVDSNGKRQTGVFDLQATVRNQQRCSTSKAYIEPASDRENLDILTNAFVTKILINEDKVAYGVQFDFKNGRHTVRARKEVIISCGSTRTPQILMLSGIGPKKHLEKFKIPVVADLPVGKNLHDHNAFTLVYTVDPSITNVIVKNLNPTNLMKYITEREGPNTAPNQVTILAFLTKLNETKPPEDFPTVELYFAEYDALNGLVNLNLKPEVYEHLLAPYEGQALYLCYSQILQPRSRGEILLNSTDPYDYPLINPNYFKEHEDVKEIVEGVKICNAIANHPKMKKVKAKLIPQLQSGFLNCGVNNERNEDKYWSCVVRKFVQTIWHPVGTARMGRANDSRSVVDPKLRVIGVKNLRVINAAVMPIIPSANTNVPTMMIAEKAYDMMKDDIMCEDEE